MSRAKRPQKGHSKSTNSTIVTFASAGPCAGLPDVFTLTGLPSDVAAPPSPCVAGRPYSTGWGSSPIHRPISTPMPMPIRRPATAQRWLRRRRIVISEPFEDKLRRLSHGPYWQALVHSSVFTLLPSSHTSPAGRFVRPSPQDVGRAVVVAASREAAAPVARLTPVDIGRPVAAVRRGAVGIADFGLDTGVALLRALVGNTVAAGGRLACVGAAVGRIAVAVVTRLAAFGYPRPRTRGRRWAARSACARRLPVQRRDRRCRAGHPGCTASPRGR